MSIIVTGAGGFVGRKLVADLLARGNDVVAVDTVLQALTSADALTKIEGDIGDTRTIGKAFDRGCDGLVHLATVPGGAAEVDPAASRRINIDAMYDLLDAAKAAGSRPRVVYASSIAVLGDALPQGGVDDTTPVSPKMIYGGHKAMMEVAVACHSNRGEIDGVTVRLSGILARPKGPSGMKSAFMSDIFHALRAREPFICPVSREATIWAQSVEQCVANLIHALSLDAALMPSTRAVTLPAVRFSMGDLADEIARQTGASADLVSWRPDPALEQAFGTQPPLATPAGEAAGFRHDGSLANLVQRALARIEEDGA